MTDLTVTPDLVRKIRLAGLFYLIIIVAGLGAELGLRGPLIDLTDADRTAAAILDAPGRFRLAIAADLVMALCDAGLAILLFLIFRSMAPGLALSAMVFRLIQTVLIAANLMAMQAAWLLISGADGVVRCQRARPDVPRYAWPWLRSWPGVLRDQQCDHGSAGLEVGTLRARVRRRSGNCRRGLPCGQRLAVLCTRALICLRPSLRVDDPR